MLLATALLASGCDSDSGEDDLPTTAQAAKDLSVWMDELEPRLTYDGPLKRWQTTEDGSTDVGYMCDEGTARRTYVATVDIPGHRPPDASDHENLLRGQLLTVGWDPSISSMGDYPSIGDVSGIVTASRAKDDPTGTTLTVMFSPVAGGWHYYLTVRTSCLPTS